MDCVVQLTLTYLGILDVTTDVERAFSRIQRLEIKSRERHCHATRLQDSLNVLLEVPSCVDAFGDPHARGYAPDELGPAAADHLASQSLVGQSAAQVCGVFRHKEIGVQENGTVGFV